VEYSIIKSERMNKVLRESKSDSPLPRAYILVLICSHSSEPSPLITIRNSGALEHGLYTRGRSSPVNKGPLKQGVREGGDLHYRTADNTTIFLNKEGNKGKTVHESFENNLRAFLFLSPAN
jgi:hypothetical protein